MPNSKASFASWFGSDPPQRPMVIAEVGQAHEGSLAIASSFVKAVGGAGADAVKFQTHLPEFESSNQEIWRRRFSSQDNSRAGYWSRTGFTTQQWGELKDQAEEENLVFLSSPFSAEAVHLLQGLDIEGWKIASGEVANPTVLEPAIATGKPILFSSGMSNWNELQRATELCRHQAVPFAIMQCTSSYPTPPEGVGLNLVQELASEFGCSTGLSDHSGTIYSSLAATVLGAQFLEVHVSMSRDQFHPDGDAAITIAELKQLVEGVRFLSRCRAHPVDKDESSASLEEMKRLFRQSVTVTRNLKAGHVLASEDLRTRKPGIGIPAQRIESLLGRKLAIDVKSGHFLAESDVSDDQT